jgi:hypothetical protein
MQSFTLRVDLTLRLDYVVYAMNNNEMSFGPFEKLEFLKPCMFCCKITLLKIFTIHHNFLDLQP